MEGYVDHIVYRNSDNGYTVLNLVAGEEEITCVGTLPFLGEGELIQARGHYTEHATYGDQFVIESYEEKQPEDAVAMERYLGYPTYLRRLALRHISSMYKMVFHFHLLDPVHLDLL